MNTTASGCRVKKSCSAVCGSGCEASGQEDLLSDGSGFNTDGSGSIIAPLCGVFPNQDGTFTAMTYTRSKTFKTEAGARRWLTRNTD
ncbi:DUF1391 domain-containing protein [Escherichia coli]|nr:DUF1391 domain-containing protein [Escherichia coli]EEW2816359.1 DUF1391 domain-containing protein [Escherichia coli]EEY7500384.1 DUF1391 domain-containing protein [Escherichia coli]EFA5196015.1 DUF1391 domain-containing protein [Escherichia coli]EFB7825240.1 DUF1391 domain-containing protein [Escherichia coli]